MTQREGAYFRPMQGAAIAYPQDAGENDRNASKKPTGPQDQGFDRDHRGRGHALLQFKLERAAATIASNRADGNERQKKGSSNFVGTKGRGDHAVERKQRVSKSCRGPTLPACFRIGSHRPDECHSD